MAGHPRITSYFSQRLRLVFLFCAVLFGSVRPVQADLMKALQEAGWAEFTFEDKPANQFLYPDGDTDVIQVDTDKSVSIVYLPFVKKTVNLKHKPILTFSWRRLGPVVDTNLTRKGGDDRTLAIYVAFPYKPEQASLKERLLRPFVEAREALLPQGRVLTYLWGSGEGAAGLKILILVKLDG